jgi:hypothetical protein
VADDRGNGPATGIIQRVSNIGDSFWSYRRRLQLRKASAVHRRRAIRFWPGAYERAAQQAGAINRTQDLSGIRVGLHDEIFQGSMPVLAGVDAASSYCYLLTAAEHRDADTWGVHLLDVTEQGLQPDYTIADAGQGLRAGQKVAWGDTPCHGDVFHIQRQYEGLANTLSRLAKGATSRRKKLEAQIERAGRRGADDELAARVELARQTESLFGWVLLAEAAPYLVAGSPAQII